MIPKSDQHYPLIERVITRGPILAQMMRRWTDELPAIPMNFSTSVWVCMTELQGPADTAAGSAVAWNISQWEFR